MKNKEKQREWMKDWRKRNPDYMKSWYAKHPEAYKRHIAMCNRNNKRYREEKAFIEYQKELE